MTTLKTVERRVTALEVDVKEIKETLASHSESIYKLRRESIKTDLRFSKLFNHFNIADISDEDVDQVLDAE